jgi:2-polyprenyl-3-methyl-5-hydroxy-6-metoxy-1,4-benzoquinol methylase
MAKFRSYSVFSAAFASALQHVTLASKRQVLDLGCGGGCWSLLLAGPRLHVTVVVAGADAYMQVLRVVYALDARAHVTVLQSDDAGSPESFLSVLKRAAAMQDAAFMGFEMVVMLDVLTVLPPVLVGDLCSALLPYMHTRSKALVSVLAMPASEAESATNW